jgi:GTP-binding protein
LIRVIKDVYIEVMIDIVQFKIFAGNGGNGLVSFHREKFVPHGGPDGGDGGRGGNVYVRGNNKLSSLREYRDQQLRRSANGFPGGPNQRHGAAGEGIILDVPVGSIVYEVGEEGSEKTILADIDSNGLEIQIAKGGRGGHGNKYFTTSTRQAPSFAQKGQTGEKKTIQIELKLIADIGIIGLPNAGKSSLLTQWSRATPKVASYPFTTLDPELGVVELGYDSFVAADMPGLIEGASQGVGLGYDFLRHIERTEILVHVVDLSQEDPLEDIQMINEELYSFGYGLSEKPQIIAFNKIDIPDGAARLELLEDEIKNLSVPVLSISAVSGHGVRELAQKAHQALVQLRQQKESEGTNIIRLRPQPQQKRFEIEESEDGVLTVKGSTPQWLAETLDLTENEARAEFFDRLSRLGVARALKRRGVKQGDLIRIGQLRIRWDD